MITALTIIHILMCVILIAIVLLQTGKGADIGAAFGGASHTLFGGAGPASFLNRVTTVAAVVFMLTSFSLALLSSQRSGSSIILERARQTQTPQNPTTEQQPAAPQPNTQQDVQPQNPTGQAPSVEEKPVNPAPSQESSGTSSGTEESQEPLESSSSEKAPQGR